MAERAERILATANRWQLWLDETPRAGWVNMAIDQTLLDRAEQVGEGWLRFYTWEPHCLSFGRHEPAARRYDAGRIAAMGIDTVRRPTGGRAVWHSRELTYAVAAPCRWFGSLRLAYLEIHRLLADVLIDLGIPVSLAQPGRSAPLTAGACFAQATGGELMVGARKLVGSAQLRRGDAFLQHGSILLQDQQQLVAALGRGSAAPPPDHFPSLPTGRLSTTRLAEAIAMGARARWGGSWQAVGAEPNMLEAALQYYPQFRSPAWTWQR
jgi:lipoate-protein ligase A